MSALITSPNLARPDEVYACLVALHDGLDDTESAAANARLILLLVNHIGDESVIRQAVRLARQSRSADHPNDAPKSAR